MTIRKEALDFRLGEQAVEKPGRDNQHKHIVAIGRLERFVGLCQTKCTCR